MAKVLILIVEDEASLADMYAANFRASGYDVDIAHEGTEGFDKMMYGHPNVVLMDIIMPGISGLETLEKAKSQPTTKDIPIIMLTNYSDSPELHNAMKEGATDFIIKADYTPSQVVEKVTKLLSVGPASLGPAQEQNPKQKPKFKKF
ncbi:MAG TPA: response regulator [Candidatus Babeliales bacterium]|nr:response regulator [Candidatus Babeliales bacterium]